MRCFLTIYKYTYIHTYILGGIASLSQMNDRSIEAKRFSAHCTRHDNSKNECSGWVGLGWVGLGGTI